MVRNSVLEYKIWLKLQVWSLDSILNQNSFRDSFRPSGAGKTIAPILTCPPGQPSGDHNPQEGLAFCGSISEGKFLEIEIRHISEFRF